MGIVYAGARPETTLARYAEYQGQTNNCGEYSVAAALSILKGQPRWMSAQEVVDVADRWTLIDTLRTLGPLGLFTGKSLRMWKGGPTTSWQAANLARRMAGKRGLKIKADVRLGREAMHDEVVSWLNRPDAITLFTIAWDDKTEAVMMDPNKVRLMLKSQPKVEIANLTIDYSAHVMVLAAYDPDQNRWGFINSWYNGDTVNGLCWISNEDFEETWGYSRSPFFIPRMWVTISLQ
jgi:hypothetical protein